MSYKPPRIAHWALQLEPVLLCGMPWKEMQDKEGHYYTPISGADRAWLKENRFIICEQCEEKFPLALLKETDL